METELGETVDADWVDGGTLGLELLTVVERSDCLLILDAVDRGEKGGSLIDMPGEEIPLFSRIRLSQHQVSFQEVLGLARIRDHFPRRIHLLGIQPVDLSSGLELSPEVNESLPLLVRRAGEILGQWK
jgi:hydrogenase maturation protease